MVAVARTDTTLIGRWWWTVDRWTLAILMTLLGFGAILVAAASPPVAERIGLGEFHFVWRHLLYLVAGGAVLFLTSLLSPVGVRRIGLLIFLVSLVALALTPFIGVEAKGARRWLSLPGMSVQPSEFVKPAFVIVSAWLFTLQKVDPRFPGNFISIALFACISALLVMQPDMGMIVVVTAVWGAQFFLAGLPIALVLGLGAFVLVGIILAYQGLPHVASRIDRFLDPTVGDNYQVARSLEAFSSGGIFGAGPGEGNVKLFLPDAHADFIFAVAGEEFGLVWCLGLLALFAMVVIRGCIRLSNENSLFVILACGGLLIQFGLQAAINMASTLHLIPTKGMTLPFVSYGGSSLLALAFGMGVLLALTRRHPGHETGWTGGVP